MGHILKNGPGAGPEFSEKVDPGTLQKEGAYTKIHCVS